MPAIGLSFDSTFIQFVKYFGYMTGDFLIGSLSAINNIHKTKKSKIVWTRETKTNPAELRQFDYNQAWIQYYSGHKQICDMFILT